MRKTLEPSFAGSFYPSDPDRLAALVRDLSGPPLPMRNGLGMVVPHAGMVYSGKTAGMAYSRAPDRVEQVILCAPSHRVFVDRAVTLDAGILNTPMGAVAVDTGAVEKLKAFGLQSAVLAEHSLEVQLPFILDRWPSAKVIPVVTGSDDPSFLEELAGILHSRFPEAFFIASSDLSHFHPVSQAEKLDMMVRKAFLALCPRDFVSALSRGGEACGRGPMLTLLHFASLAGASRAMEIHYSTSADAGGDRREVVGYFSAMILRREGRQC